MKTEEKIKFFFFFDKSHYKHHCLHLMEQEGKKLA